MKVSKRDCSSRRWHNCARRDRCFWGCVVFFWIAMATSAWSASPWHLPGWNYRVQVQVVDRQPAPGPGMEVDTAGARLYCQGRAKADGSDLRVVNSAGQSLPFLLHHHDAHAYSLISFRIDNLSEDYFIYFGNPTAARAIEQIVQDDKPGAGPPQAAWIPRFGFTLATRQRPLGSNPKDVADLADLMAKSPQPFGARYQRQVSEGVNPFGPSDYYLSVYRGWIQIPRTGKYQFCTASNEASFSFLDGKALIHWPGRHTAERGSRGEKNALVELNAGLHYLEYYHEEVVLQQMAFLGWRPSGDIGPFEAIPESIFTAAHGAHVTRYESPKGAVPFFTWEIMDSLWPEGRFGSQYTRLRFQARVLPAPPAGTVFHWDFGDGQSVQGSAVEHVYLTLGKFPVTLTVRNGNEVQSSQAPVTVFEIQHVLDTIKQGKPLDYARTARKYDRAKMEAAHLRELAFLLADAEQFADSLTAGKDYLTRFAASEPRAVATMRRLLATCAIQRGDEGLDEAIAQYHASLTAETSSAERFDVLARLLVLVGIHRQDRARGEELVKTLERLIASAPLKPQPASKPRTDQEEEAEPRGDSLVTTYRRALIALGDFRLWHGQLDEARGYYQRAERVGDFIPSQVRAARIGSYPNALREFTENNNHDAALDLIEEWEQTFPTEKIAGQTFYWRGKIAATISRPRAAARWLARAVGLAPGAAFETEARWLLAQALEQMGRRAESKVELAKLVATGFDDRFTKFAREKLARDK